MLPYFIVELLCGRIRGAAIERLAKEGVPERMWSRIADKEISERSGPDLPEIRKRVEDMPAMLDNWNINLAIGNGNVLELAREVVCLIYMSAADSIIYAAAIAARADYLVTDDGYLHQTVNLIHTPSGQRRYRKSGRSYNNSSMMMNYRKHANAATFDLVTERILSE